MRIAQYVIGLILVIAGVAAWLGKIDYPHEKEVVKIGNLSASVSTHRTVPQWAGGIAALAGIGLIGAGLLRKR